MSDFISFLSLHIYLVHSFLAYFYHTVLIFIRSLFRVFRGKKKNPLRGNRVDTVDFQLDRFLLGTLLFTPLCFLYPTIALYYFYYTILVLKVGLLRVFMVTMAALVVNNPVMWTLHWMQHRSNYPVSVHMQTTFIWGNNYKPKVHTLVEVPMQGM